MSEKDANFNLLDLSMKDKSGKCPGCGRDAPPDWQTRSFWKCMWCGFRWFA